MLQFVAGTGVEPVSWDYETHGVPLAPTRIAKINIVLGNASDSEDFFSAYCFVTKVYYICDDKSS